MLLSINHITKYNYDEHLKGVIQSTKLIPSPYNGLKIKKWEVTKNNQKGGEVFRDAEGNNIVNFRSDHTEQNVSFHVVGEVETVDTNGLFESLNDKIDPLVYLRNTSLTIPNKKIIQYEGKEKIFIFFVLRYFYFLF